MEIINHDLINTNNRIFLERMVRTISETEEFINPGDNNKKLNSSNPGDHKEQHNSSTTYKDTSYPTYTQIPDEINTSTSTQTYKLSIR